MWAVCRAVLYCTVVVSTVCTLVGGLRRWRCPSLRLLQTRTHHRLFCRDVDGGRDGNDTFHGSFTRTVASSKAYLLIFLDSWLFCPGLPTFAFLLIPVKDDFFLYPLHLCPVRPCCKLVCTSRGLFADGTSPEEATKHCVAARDVIGPKPTRLQVGLRLKPGLFWERCVFSDY